MDGTGLLKEEPPLIASRLPDRRNRVGHNPWSDIRPALGR
jgi:hypothetical protein